MKRFISLVLIMLLVLSCAFKVHANIEDYDTDEYDYFVSNGLCSGSKDTITNFYPVAGTLLVNGYDDVFSSSFKNNISYENTYMGDYFYFVAPKGALLFEYGSDVGITVTNLRHAFTAQVSSRSDIYVKHDYNTHTSQDFIPVKWICQVKDVSNNWRTIEDNIIYDVKSTNSTGSKYDFTCVIGDIPCDVYEIRFICYYKDYQGGVYVDSSMYGGNHNWYSGFDKSEFYFSEYNLSEKAADEEEEETNNWLENIFNFIKNLPSMIANSFTDFFDDIGSSISNLGSTLLSGISNLGSSILTGLTNLGTFIVNGVKDLFIPSEEDIVNIKDNWESLLSDRFGAVYQSFDYIMEFAKKFTNKSSVSTITMPSLTVNLAGTDFTFGGYAVQLVPSGMENIVAILKKIISLVCTLGFLNVMKNRFSKMLGGD